VRKSPERWVFPRRPDGGSALTCTAHAGYVASEAIRKRGFYKRRCRFAAIDAQERARSEIYDRFYTSPARERADRWRDRSGEQLLSHLDRPNEHGASPAEDGLIGTSALAVAYSGTLPEPRQASVTPRQGP